MSQMRKDVFTGRWVIVAANATLQPSNFHFKKLARETTFCPFCETNEASTPPEVFAIRNPEFVGSLWVMLRGQPSANVPHEIGIKHRLFLN